MEETIENPYQAPADPEQPAKLRPTRLRRVFSVVAILIAIYAFSACLIGLGFLGYFLSERTERAGRYFLAVGMVSVDFIAALSAAWAARKLWRRPAGTAEWIVMAASAPGAILGNVAVVLIQRAVFP